MPDHLNSSSMPATDVVKLLGIWTATLWGAINVQTIALSLTIVYTLVQLYITIRDNIIRRRQ